MTGGIWPFENFSYNVLSYSSDVAISAVRRKLAFGGAKSKATILQSCKNLPKTPQGRSWMCHDLLRYCKFYFHALLPHHYPSVAVSTYTFLQTRFVGARQGSMWGVTLPQVLVLNLNYNIITISTWPAVRIWSRWGERHHHNYLKVGDDLL